MNFTRPIYTGEHEDDELYNKSFEAQTVFFVDDQKKDGWCILVHLKPRELYDMGEGDEENYANIEVYPLQKLDDLLPDGDTHSNDTQLSTIGEHFEAENDS